MVKLNRIGVIKAACFSGLFGVFMGLIFGLFFVISTYMLKDLISSLGGTLNIGLGWISLIIFPLGFGVLSFLTGLIFTPLMNLVLKIIKGLDLDMVE